MNWRGCHTGVGRGVDDPHRGSDGYSGPPRVECDFVFLSSRVNLAGPGLTIFDMTDMDGEPINGSGSQCEGCKRSPGKIFLGYGGRVETIRCQGGGMTLILREVQARGQENFGGAWSVRQWKATRPCEPW